MPFAKKQPPDTTGDSQDRQKARRGRLGLWLPAIGITLIVLALAAVLLARAADGGAILSDGGGVIQGSSTAVVPANWHTFHDAKGLYTLRYPPDWTVSGGTDHDGSTCIEGQCAAIDHEGYTFINPSQGSGTVYVHIDIFLFPSDTFRLSACRSKPPGSRSQFHGFPAFYMNQGQWVFDTEAGNFQFTVSIPGAIDLPVGIPNASTPTAIPSSWTTTDQQEVTTFLDSFTLIGAKHLSCS